jgi:hypothetical protein
MIGKTIATQVTSVLQTTAGKMIFGRFPEEAEQGGGSQQSQRQDRRSYEKSYHHNNYEKSYYHNRTNNEDERERVKGR